MYRSKKERDYKVLKFHRVETGDWKRVKETHELLTFRKRQTGEKIELRY